MAVVMDNRDRRIHGIGLIQLMLPVSDVVAIVVVGVLVGLAARELNEQARTDAQIRLSGTLGNIEDLMIERALEFTWLDESIKRLIIVFDIDWALDRLGRLSERIP